MGTGHGWAKLEKIKADYIRVNLKKNVNVGPGGVFHIPFFDNNILLFSL